MRKSAKLRRQNKKEPTGILERLPAGVKRFGQKSKSIVERPKSKPDSENSKPKRDSENSKPKRDSEHSKPKPDPENLKPERSTEQLKAKPGKKGQKSNVERKRPKTNTELQKPISITDRLNPKLIAERLNPKSITERLKPEATTEPLKNKTSAEGGRPKRKTRHLREKQNTRRQKVYRRVGKWTRKRTMLLFGVVLTIALISLVTILGVRASMRNYLERYEGEVFLTGVFIDGVEVSGMTMNQALDQLRSRLRGFQNNTITFDLENGRSFSGTLGDIGLSIEQLDPVVREAFDYGRDLSLSRRVRLLRRSNEGRLELEFPLTYRVSRGDLTEFLESHMEEYLNIPINARLESGPYGVTIIPDQIGEVFDIENAYQELSDYINSGWNRANVSFELEVIHEEAKVVASQLEGMTDLLGTFTTTFYDSPENRAQNISTGAGHINHLFMAPGDELSACTLMRPYTEENGYAYGNMFAGHMVVEAIGGGVCQVVSTLYMALLHAEIEIVQRNNHTMPVDYVPLAMDAAVAEDVLDLRWRNDMSTPIYIESIVVPGQSITYNIFGRETRPENRTIEFVNWSEWGEAPEGAQFVASPYGIGAMWIESEARPSIYARLYKVIFIDGEEVERVQVNASHYLESPRIWRVGTDHPNPDNTAWMLGAIGSQNYDYIRNTINQIQSGGGGYTGGYTGGDTGGYTEGYSGYYY